MRIPDASLGFSDPSSLQIPTDDCRKIIILEVAFLTQSENALLAKCRQWLEWDRDCVLSIGVKVYEADRRGIYEMKVIVKSDIKLLFIVYIVAKKN